VPDAALIGGLGPTSFLAGHLLQFETLVTSGRAVGDGTFEIGLACPHGALIAGGPANLSPGTSITESSPIGGKWLVRVNPHGGSDPYSVIVLCAVLLSEAGQ
jgi:hypothetical protein